MQHKHEGVKSPYPDDPNTYLWNWNQDVYVCVETGMFIVNEPMTREQALRLINGGGFVANQVDREAFGSIDGDEISFEVYCNAQGSPLGIMANGPNGSVMFNHPAWKDVDWEYHVAQE